MPPARNAKAAGQEIEIAAVQKMSAWLQNGLSGPEGPQAETELLPKFGQPHLPPFRQPAGLMSTPLETTMPAHLPPTKQGVESKPGQPPWSGTWDHEDQPDGHPVNQGALPPEPVKLERKELPVPGQPEQPIHGLASPPPSAAKVGPKQPPRTQPPLPGPGQEHTGNAYGERISRQPPTPTVQPPLSKPSQLLKDEPHAVGSAVSISFAEPQRPSPQQAFKITVKASSAQASSPLPPPPPLPWSRQPNQEAQSAKQPRAEVQNMWPGMKRMYANNAERKPNPPGSATEGERKVRVPGNRYFPYMRASKKKVSEKYFCVVIDPKTGIETKQPWIRKQQGHGGDNTIMH